MLYNVVRLSKTSYIFIFSGPVLIEEEIPTLSLDTIDVIVNLMDLEIVF